MAATLTINMGRRFTAQLALSNFLLVFNFDKYCTFCVNQSKLRYLITNITSEVWARHVCTIRPITEDISLKLSEVKCSLALHVLLFRINHRSYPTHDFISCTLESVLKGRDAV